MHSIVYRVSQRFTVPRFWMALTKQTLTKEKVTQAQASVERDLRKHNWKVFVYSSYYPRELRQDYLALQLFELKLSTAVDCTSNHQLAMGKLEFWRTVVNNIFETDVVTEQPLSIALTHACMHNPLSKNHLIAMINARTRELHSSLQTMMEMRELAEQVKFPLLALQLELLRIEIDNEHIAEVTSSLSQSLGIVRYIEYVPFSFQHGKHFLPASVLSKHNIRSNKIWDRIYGKPVDELGDAILEIASYGKATLEQAIQRYTESQEKIHPQAFRAFLIGVEVQRYLKQLQEYNFDVFALQKAFVNPLKLPSEIHKAAKNKRFYTGEYSAH